MRDEAVRFGLFMLRTMLTGLAVAVLLAWLAGQLPEGMGFCLFLLPLREYSGGFHMKTKKGCAVVSLGIYLATLWVFENTEPGAEIVLVAYILLGALFIYLTPIDNPRNKLDNEEKAVMERKSLMIFGAETVLFLAFWGMGLLNAAFVICIALLVCDCLLILGKLSNAIQNRDL